MSQTTTSGSGFKNLLNNTHITKQTSNNRHPKSDMAQVVLTFKVSDQETYNLILSKMNQFLTKLQTGEQDYNDDIAKILSCLTRITIQNHDVLAFTNNVNISALDQEIKDFRTSPTPDPNLVKLVQNLINDAEKALQEGLFSVTDKTTLPPSNNPNDYWNPAPYWWPNPDTPTGLPYVRRDGMRVPGTNLYGEDNERYDRTRLQRVFNNSFVLMLAWKFTDDIRYAEHVAKILERFFINPETAMTPHLDYAQVRMGHNKDKSNYTSIIEMKDLYFYLDVITIINTSGAISPETLTSFKQWLSQYLEWLQTSKQGIKGQTSVNNHGTFFDLQIASIANFLGRTALLYETFAYALTRIANQFESDGSQLHELDRATSAHYCFFNIQGWSYLAEFGGRWGINIWDYQAENGASLRIAIRWLLSYMGTEWPYPQIDEFDSDRFHKTWHLPPPNVVESLHAKLPVKPLYQIKPIFDPNFAIRPYWNIGHRFSESQNNT